MNSRDLFPIFSISPIISVATLQYFQRNICRKESRNLSKQTCDLRVKVWLVNLISIQRASQLASTFIDRVDRYFPNGSVNHGPDDLGHALFINLRNFSRAVNNSKWNENL